ncbi:ABC transporter substrate-binding protein [Streptomyces spiralis]|uniref:ABC transporter substrate-binding protein n=1 Tax=Streptomyces spiralis TaxID=66376 RepID=UPI0033F421D2
MRHKIAFLSAALSGLLMLAGCTVPASSGSSSASGGGSVRGVTGSSVKVGGIMYKTTTYGASVSGADLGAKAAFMEANAAGGVNGRKIDYIGAEDDHADPAANLSAVRKLVDQDGVFALVPVETYALGGSAYLQQKNVPFVGWGYLPQFCNNPYAFGFNGCDQPAPGSGGSGSPVVFGALAKATGGARGRSVFLFGSDDQVNRQTVAMVNKGAALVGYKVVGTDTTIPQTSVPSDWTPFVHKVMTADHGRPPAIVSSMMSTPNNVGLFTALRGAGYRGILTDSISFGPNLLSNRQINHAFQGAYVSTPVQTPDSKQPAVQTMKTWLQKAAGTTNLQYTQDMGVGYASAKVFLAILKAAGRDLTPQSFVKAGAHITIKNPISGDISFPAGRIGTNGCQALTQVRGSQVKQVTDLVCGPLVPMK